MKKRILKILVKLLNKIKLENDLSSNKGTVKKWKYLVSSRISGNVDVGENSNISDSCLLGNIKIGKNIYIKKSNISGNVMINENCRLYEVNIKGDNIKIGRYTSLWGPNLHISQKNNLVEIGSFCSIARNVSIQEYNHNSNKISTYYIGQNIFNEKWENEQISKGKVVIGHDVWIGANCQILAGVTIGDGAIIGSNSVVTKDIPPYSIAIGAPARPVKFRFNKEAIDNLLEIKWWEWSEEKIKKNKDLFESTNWEEFLKDIK